MLCAFWKNTRRPPLRLQLHCLLLDRCSFYKNDSKKKKKKKKNFKESLQIGFFFLVILRQELWLKKENAIQVCN